MNSVISYNSNFPACLHMETNDQAAIKITIRFFFKPSGAPLSHSLKMNFAMPEISKSDLM